MINRRNFILGAVLVAFGLFSPISRGRMPAEAGVAVIVNSNNPVTELSAQEVTDLYLKKRREWPDGVSVRFIDQEDGSSLRKRFLSGVLGKTSREIDLYWIGQKLYTGDSAPIQAHSDEMVANLVSRFKGGIGYVSPEFAGLKGVKKVRLTGAR